MQYSDIAQYVEAGLTDQEIADALKASGLTPRKIALADLLFLLNNRAMLIRLIRPSDTGEKWSGSVVDMILYVNDSGTPEQITAVNQWFSHLTNDRNSYYDTTVVSYAAPLWQMRNLFGGQPTMPTVEDFDAIAGLGGGWLYADVTAVDVADLRLQQERRAAYESIANRANAATEAAAEAYRAPEPTVAEIIAAGESAFGVQ